MVNNSETPWVLAGKYRLTRLLGRGGMGSVWHAEHLLLRSAVAVKLIDPVFAQDASALARFQREAQAAASLRGPHVVQVLDFGVDGSTPFIVMELLEGESLSDLLGRVNQLAPVEASRVVTQVARAIGKAHEHEPPIVHRDLKPANIFLVLNDGELLCKVLDFGIAKSNWGSTDTAAALATQTGAILGTPYYMSPEQAEGLRSIDFRSDIWALGVIAYECLLGQRPFVGPTPAGVVLAICTRPLPVPSSVGAVPAGFDAWFARACARDPDERFASAKAAAEALRALCEGQPSPLREAIPPAVGYVATLADSNMRSSTTTHPIVSSLNPAAPASPYSLKWLPLAALLGLAGLVTALAVYWRVARMNGEPAPHTGSPAPLASALPPVASASASIGAVPSPTPAPAPPQPEVEAPATSVEARKPSVPAIASAAAAVPKVERTAPPKTNAPSPKANSGAAPPHPRPAIDLGL